MRRGGDSFQTIKTEGSIVPSDFLRRLLDGDSDIPGFKPEDYHLAKSERLNEVATRAWNRIQGAWEGFSEAIEKLPESDTGTSLTREKWLLILFQELGYGRLTTRKATELHGKSYPISHEWQNTPIHLVSFRQELDRRTPGRAGAARVSPHSLLQEFLNRSEDHLWGFVSNGQSLRLLRDNASLTRQAYVEFDLQAMMDSEAYSDFFLLFLLSHQSRVEIPEGKGPSHCWLEKWYNTASQQGVRALDQLRNGVQNAIESLGGGFLAYPGNHELRDKLKTGELSTQEYYRQVLRQVYRLLFLFVAEDRDLLLDPNSPADSRKLYNDYYATKRIRRLAGRIRGTRHPDLWRGLNMVLNQLHDGCPSLGIPAFGSFLFSEKATEALSGQDIANSDLLKAIRALAYTIDRNVLQPVNYRNLGPEELGSVYESLLEMHPEIRMEASNPADRFRLTVAAGSERKTTGSYYTPTSLVNCLLDSALDPVIDETIRKPDPEKSLLSLKVCDPACGSGHFLIAAAHRIAKRLASIRAGEEEPSPIHYQHALRDIIGNCIYGVDINPMSVELCKVSLWLEAIEPGHPLSFLDHRIRCGNSLLGATPALLAKGIPDEAFKPIEGDDKTYCSEYKKQNKKERESHQAELFDRDAMPWERLGNLPTAIMQLDSITDATLEGIAEKEKRYAEYVESAGYRNCHLWADAWCAAFVWVKRPERENGFPFPITEEVYRRIEHNPYSIPPWMVEEIQRLAKQYQFFHWHIEFPDVFRVPQKGESIDNQDLGWSGGFDCALGNPPWERIKIQDKEWFSIRRPDIAAAPNAAARHRMIDKLKEDDPDLYKAFLDDRRGSEGESTLLRDTGRFPLCGCGDVNTYAVFTELSSTLLSVKGIMGLLVPLGIATAKTTMAFFENIMSSHTLLELLGFINEEMLFPAVLHNFKFCILAIGGTERIIQTPEFVFNAYNVAEAREDDRRFVLSNEDIQLLNPITKTCPTFFWKESAEVTKRIYRVNPIMDVSDDRSGWEVQLFSMLHMGTASELFYTAPNNNSSPVYESKMFNQFNHRFGSHQGLATGERSHMLPEATPDLLLNPTYKVTPCYYVDRKEVEQRLKEKVSSHWLLATRRISSAGLIRTGISTVLPRCGASDSISLVMTQKHNASQMAIFCGMFNSFAFDFCVRQKLAEATMSFYIVSQLPVIPMTRLRGYLSGAVTEEIDNWLVKRLLELLYTSWELQYFADDCGYQDPPFKWNDDRRFLIRCEVDSAYFHLFEISRDDVEYIMGTFPLVKARDEQMYGSYRTKNTMLEIYDEMAAAMCTGKSYQTRLDPPPGPPLNPDGSFAKLPDWPSGNPKPKGWPSHIHEPRRDQ